MQFSCSYTETQGVYGAVSGDNNLVVSHSPATADAEHVFTLENGMLKVEIPDGAGNGTEYKLVDGVLSVNSGFTGTITAEYAFTTSPTREIDFEYDHNGLRTQKKVVENGITTIYDYTLHGKLITHLTKRVVDLDGSETTEELHFFYDSLSRPAFVKYENTVYRYVHNLQGDIVSIVDTEGNPVVEYKYDAWGNPIYEAGSLLSSLGNLNAFRYRGYVWDGESKLYYLKSRYYSSAIVRFINADSIIQSDLMMSNSFAYCLNKPVDYIDEDGNLALLTTLLLAGAANVIGGLIGRSITGTATHGSDLVLDFVNGMFVAAATISCGFLGALFAPTLVATAEYIWYDCKGDPEKFEFEELKNIIIFEAAGAAVGCLIPGITDYFPAKPNQVIPPVNQIMDYVAVESLVAAVFEGVKNMAEINASQVLGNVAYALNGNKEDENKLIATIKSVYDPLQGKYRNIVIWA